MANVKALLLKIVLAGESFVGKTSILKRYTDSKFDASFLTTVGIDFKVKTIKIDGKTVKLQIWDTAGQERFHTLTTNYFRGAHGIVLVYDITNSKSFKNVSGWIRDIDKNASEDLDKVLLGNKCDMEEERVVKKESGEKLGWEYGMRFFETSAKDDINIDIAFLSLAGDILSKNPYFTTHEIEIIEETPIKKNKCCDV